jgi:hypothetical protein
MDYTEILLWLSSFWTLATVGIPFVIEFIYKKIVEPQTSLWKSIWSWAIPIIGFYVAWIVGTQFDIGFLAEYELWWTPAIMGAFAAAISNYGWNNIPWIKTAIINIIDLLPKTKKVEEDK